MLSYLLAKMNFLEKSVRQISDAVQRYEPSTLRMELRHDVAEVVESQSTHIQQVVQSCVDDAVVKLEGALMKHMSSAEKVTHGPSAQVSHGLSAPPGRPLQIQSGERS